MKRQKVVRVRFEFEHDKVKVRAESTSRRGTPYCVASAEENTHGLGKSARKQVTARLVRKVLNPSSDVS